MIKQNKPTRTYAKHPKFKGQILLLDEDINTFINISNPNEVMAYAPYEIPRKRQWKSKETPEEVLECTN